MTVYELRALAAIISHACRQLPGQDASDLARDMWLFLAVKRPDLTLAIWQAMIDAAGSSPGNRPLPGTFAQAAQHEQPDELMLQTADGPSALRAVMCRPDAIPPYVIVTFDDPLYGERFAAYERLASQWVMTGTMLTRDDAEAWVPGSEEAGGAPVPEVAMWLDHLTADVPSRARGAHRAVSPSASSHEGAGLENPPCMRVAGTLVFAYIDSGTLVVSLDLDTTSPDLLDSVGNVPVQITIQGTTVFESAAG